MPHAVRHRLGQIPGTTPGPDRKTQWGHMVNMMIVGPGMIYSALRVKPPFWLQAGMVFAGTATVVYSLYNFLLQQRAAVEAQRSIPYVQATAEPPTREDLLR